MWGLRQGAKGYLGKPVDEAELMAQINELLRS
jgi:twitching motility two-component system response regulator PilH